VYQKKILISAAENALPCLFCQAGSGKCGRLHSRCQTGIGRRDG
jgi:hypothetical protein